MIRIRRLTSEEEQALEKLSHCRTAPARTVERARIAWLSHQRRSVRAIAQELGLSGETVRTWLKRFNEHGLAGLDDLPRSGRPWTYSPQERAEVIATALTRPRDLDLPFACWTLDRLQAYLNEKRAIPIKRSRIDELLLDEGLRWRTQETWFGEKADPELSKHSKKLDPDFAEKRGASRRSMAPRRKAA